jgi:hypothetical protein
MKTLLIGLLFLLTQQGSAQESMVQALNFFFDNGWDLETSFLLSIEGSGHVYHHLLRRKKS